MSRNRSVGGLTAILVLAMAAIGVLILLVALIDSGAAVEPPVVIDRENRTPLIKVENQVITRYDLDVTRQYHKLRAGTKGFVIPDHGILLDAMSRAAWEEVLRKYGEPLTPEAISNERARMERESKDRDTQRKIISLLDAYPGMFELIVVRPSLANHWIHRLHDTNRTIQREAYEKAELELKEALRDADNLFRRRREEDPDACRRVDSRQPLSHHPVPEGGVGPTEPEKERAKQEAFEFANTYLGKVRPGDVRADFVDAKGAYLIARLVERTADYVVYDVLAVRKTSFEPWFEAELMKLKGEVLDPKFREILREELKENSYGRWLFGGKPQ